MQILKWFASLFTSTPPKPRELCFVPYTKAEWMLRGGEGWRLAPEEDRNRKIGWVYLERDK